MSLNKGEISRILKSYFKSNLRNIGSATIRFGSESTRKVSKGIFEQVLNLLIINFVIPIWFAYGQYFQNSEWQERCFDLLQEVSAESNFIVRKFFESGWRPNNSFDTQGMIGLYRNYCTPKKCLTCKVAQSLIRSENK